MASPRSKGISEMTDKIIERWEVQYASQKKQYDDLSRIMESLLNEFDRCADERGYIQDRMDAIQDKIISRQNPVAF